MKTKTIFLLIFTISIYSCKTTTQIDAQQKSDKAIIIQVNGKVLLSDKLNLPISSWEPVKMRSVISTGKYIRTRRMSSCVLLLNNGTKIKIIENSLVLLEKITSTPKKGLQSKFKLHIGSLLAKSSKLVNDSSFNISTPTAVAGVRGTEFIVSYKNGNTNVSVNEGKVWLKRNITIPTANNDRAKQIANTASQTIELNSGQISTVNVEDNRQIQHSIQVANTGGTVDINKIKNISQIKTREVNQTEQQRFIEFDELRRMPSSYKKDYGVLVVYGGPGTKILINGKVQGYEMVMKIAKIGEYTVEIIKGSKTLKKVTVTVKSKQKTEVKYQMPIFDEPQTIQERKIFEEAKKNIKVFPNDAPNTNSSTFRNNNPNTNVNLNNDTNARSTQNALNRRTRNVFDNDATREQRNATSSPNSSSYGSQRNTTDQLDRRVNRNNLTNSRRDTLRNQARDALNE